MTDRLRNMPARAAALACLQDPATFEELLGPLAQHEALRAIPDLHRAVRLTPRRFRPLLDHCVTSAVEATMEVQTADWVLMILGELGGLRSVCCSDKQACQ